MKKRIACFLLTLIMLVSLVPAAALTASAASLSISEAAITVLKKLTPFKGTCYQVANTQEVRIGYGTICEKDHKFAKDASGKYVMTTVPHDIKENEADKALRAALADYDKKVNSFASSNKLSLTQNQHDALVIFSFGCGTAWMDGNGVLKTAIVNKVGANELLNAMNLWTNNADINRRKVEVNMYMNGVYSNVVPTSYAKVTYNANGGAMAQGTPYEYYFDTTKTVSHIPTPTKNGSTFLGWYKDSTVWSPSLSSDCAEKTLYALWQAHGLAAGNASSNPTVNYSLAKSKLASDVIFDLPDVKSGKQIGTVSASTLTVDKDYIGSDGTRWAHISSGWVIVTAGTNGVPSSNTGMDIRVTVTNSYVNMRKDANIYSAKVGTWNQGDTFHIIDTETNNGFLWGKVVKNGEFRGWVALMYTNWNEVKDGTTSADTGSSSSVSNVVATATITFNGYVNVRSDAGTDNKIVGALAKNETVDVYEIKTVNGHQWGRTSFGWFCMTYAKVNMLVSDSKVSDAGALAYTFTGTTAGGKAHVEAGVNTNYVSFSDAKGNVYNGIPTGTTTSVTITNMKVVDGVTWAKVTWKNPEKDKNNNAISVTRSGWVILSNVTPLALGDDTVRVALEPVKFTVSCDELSVRDYDRTGTRAFAGNSENLVIKLNKGVEIKVTDITLIGENIWGYTAFELDENNYDGYVNLASKYVSRTNPPTVEKEEPVSSKLATIVGADTVRVRCEPDIYSKQVGSLSRGATAKILDYSDGWYRLDVSNNSGTESWVYKDYIEVSDSSTTTSGGSSATRTTGTGIVANTYSGVNVRSGAGIGYGQVGKLLPGTVVEILESKTVGASKWGRVSQGWICMDYVTMISYDEIPGGSETNTNTDPSKGTAVDSLDKVEKTTTTAVYTGTVTQDGVNIRKSPALDADVVRVVNMGEPITMHELVMITDYVDEQDASGYTTTTMKTSYWARVNEGYIYNPGQHLALDALDEKVHTLTGSDTLNIRSGETNPISESTVLGKLAKGDQVKVTKLKIENDKVWGWAETKDGYEGWIRLDYMSEGAYYVNETPAPTTPTAPTTPAPTIGSTGNTGTGGFVNNTSGYKYTGKVIRNGTTALKVRSTPSTSASVTTSLNNGASLVIYETTIADGMAWGRCDAGWVYLYYVDLTPSSGSAIDAKVVYTENAIAYTDSNCSEVAGTYSRMSVVDIYEVVGKMARTDMGWVSTDDIA